MFQESQPSVFWFQPVWGPSACAQPEVTILHQGGGLSSCRRAQRCTRLFCTSPQEEPGPAPSLHCCFFLHHLIPLISNCLTLPFGTQGRSRRLKAFFLQTGNWGHKGFCAWEGPAQFQPPFSLICLSRVEQVLERKITF